MSYKATVIFKSCLGGREFLCWSGFPKPALNSLGICNPRIQILDHNNPEIAIKFNPTRILCTLGATDRSLYL
jgi:hypothetical protein